MNESILGELSYDGYSGDEENNAQIQKWNDWAKKKWSQAKDKGFLRNLRAKKAGKKLLKNVRWWGPNGSQLVLPPSE